jgi:hypothetical protein
MYRGSFSIASFGPGKNSQFTIGKYLANAMFWIIISLLRFLAIFGRKIALMKKKTLAKYFWIDLKNLQ